MNLPTNKPPRVLPVWAVVGLLAASMACFAVGSAAAQAAAAYAGALSVARGVGTGGSKKISIPSPPKGKSKFLHLPMATRGTDVEANRRALEDGAGEDAGTLLLRSKPNKARVWVEGKQVGNTPLLLILAPGSYRVEARAGPHVAARRQVEVGPQEKQEVVVRLKARYPKQVRLR